MFHVKQKQVANLNSVIWASKNYDCDTPFTCKVFNYGVSLTIPDYSKPAESKVPTRRFPQGRSSALPKRSRGEYQIKSN